MPLPTDQPSLPFEAYSCGPENTKWGFNANNWHLVNVSHFFPNSRFQQLTSARFESGSGPCVGNTCDEIHLGTAGGDETVVHKFSGGSDGTYATGITVKNGIPFHFYGITPDGGDAGFGTVFELLNDGYLRIYHIVYKIDPGPGAHPTSISSDWRGNLYVTGPLGTMRLLKPISLGAKWSRDLSYNSRVTGAPWPGAADQGLVAHKGPDSDETVNVDTMGCRDAVLEFFPPRLRPKQSTQAGGVHQ